MTFQQAVMATREPVRSALKPGKRGMKGEHRWQVDCAKPERITASFDLDAAYAKAQPQANRWDYGLGFQEQDGKETALWIEIHPASPGEVDVVLRKHQWLLNWLKTEARELASLSRRPSGGKIFFWLATASGVNIRRGSFHARRLQNAGFDLPRQKMTLS